MHLLSQTNSPNAHNSCNGMCLSPCMHAAVAITAPFLTVACSRKAPKGPNGTAAPLASAGWGALASNMLAHYCTALRCLAPLALKQAVPAPIQVRHTHHNSVTPSPPLQGNSALECVNRTCPSIDYCPEE